MSACNDYGLKIHDDIALVSLALSPTWPDYKNCSGVNELLHNVGALAVDTLVAHTPKNERGTPSQRRVHMLEGKWNPGKTMRHRH
ncbi:hypothetical protein QEH59_10265 [Coraliomargarita sp. SDUM461004]|uniref:Uncharacterized protein n=1 Tax=Thalassobacterium sedimentorum TaxID=3041258 RepID=A0ABU1AM16_9BACT|nr:hypothetical protein [Coraliomargarita sp. SDUM461004]MDQ8194811.1 hypothetical protein [Coraliomargarita sp. SDUM461004]